MISAVIIAFAFVTPAFTLPLTTQGQTTTGIEQTVGDYVKETFQSAEPVIPNTPQVEKTEYQGTQKVYNEQQQQQHQQQQPFEAVGEKAGVQSSPQTYSHGVNTPVGSVGYQAGQEVYTQEKTSGADAVRPVSSYVEQVGAQNVPEVERRPESVTPVSTHVEKTGSHATPTEYPNQQQPVLLPVNPDTFPKQVEPVNVAVPEPQQILPVPITPGIQPLSVLPVPANQIVNPIVVPTEGVTGRLIIMSIEPIQRVFQPEPQNTVGSVEKQVPQQVNQPVDYTPVQGQVVEPSNQQYLSAQTYVPENVEKQVPQQQPVQAANEAFTPVQQQVAEQPQQQLYNVQPQPQANVAPVASNVEKQNPYHQETQASHYVPTQQQEVEPNQQQPLNAQQVIPQQPQIKTEQQLPYQQTQVQNTEYTPNTPYPAQKIQPVQQGVATHVPEHVPQNEHPKQSLPNQPAQSVQQLQSFSCIPAQTLSAASPNPQVQSVKPVSNPQN